MSEITGNVQSIEERYDKNNKLYHIVTVNDVKMGAWKSEHIENIKVGQEATVFYDEQGQFKNISGSIPVIQQGGSEFPGDTTATSTPLGMPVPLPVDKQVLIIRQSSLRSAVELVKRDDDVDVEKLMVIAKRFEEFVKSGE